MRVIYKQTLKPLYTFEEKDIRIWDILPGAKILFHNGRVWEVHEAQGKNHIVCNVENVVEIIDSEKKSETKYAWCDVCDFLAVDKETGYCHVCNK